MECGLEEGVADLSHALEHDPHDPRALLSRASMLFQLERQADALRDVDRALANEPRSTYCHLLRAGILRAQGDLPGARAACEQLVELDPQATQGWSLLGLVCRELGDREGAHGAFRSAHALNPGDPRLAAGLLSFELNRDNDVASGLFEALTRAPAHDEKVAVSLAQYRVVVGRDLAGGVAILDEFLARHRTSPQALGLRALLRARLGDLAGASADAELGVLLEPRESMALLARASLRLTRGDFVGAEQDATTAIAISPAYAGGYLTRAEVREQRDDLPGFLADAERAFALEPRPSEVRLVRGRALLANRQVREAEEIFTGLIERGEEVLNASAHRAEARILLAEFSAAASDAERARALAPDEPKLDLLLAEALARGGERAPAIVAVERYLARAPADAPGLARARELLEALRH